ncbi:MAG: HD domain-containing phosphohydrolase [Planctomycetota bacterium]
MPEKRITALDGLVTAVRAIALYGVDHAASRDAVHRAVQLFERALQGRDEFRVVFMQDRIVIDEIIINDARLVERSLRGSLRELGLQALRFRGTIDHADVIAFAEGLNEGSTALANGRLGTDRLHAGAIGASSGESRTQSGGLARVCRPLAALHAGLENDARFDSEGLERIANAVLLSTTKQQATMLELVEIENHDQYTMAHSVNVSTLSGALARVVGIGEQAVERIVMAGLLHDIGKRAVPTSILLKNGPLSDTERRAILQHPVAGAKMLLGRSDIPLVASVVAYEHHRRLDRRGYPEPASASTPGVTSQIVQIADIYDALRSHRPYRAGLSLDEVLEIMSKDAGKAYDRPLFDVFVSEVITRTPLGQRTAPSSDQVSTPAA